jgi:hypothetical protein
VKEKVKQWTWNDGWILMSIYLVQSKEETSLADVISAADETNHAIPTPNELSNAFTKLINAGVLKIEKNNYKLSNEYLGEIEKAYKTKGGKFESANKGEKWLNKTGLEVIKSPRLTVTQEEVENAYKLYTSSLGKKG